MATNSIGAPHNTVGINQLIAADLVRVSSLPEQSVPNHLH